MLSFPLWKAVQCFWNLESKRKSVWIGGKERERPKRAKFSFLSFSDFFLKNHNLTNVRKHGAMKDIFL